MEKKELRILNRYEVSVLVFDTYSTLFSLMDSLPILGEESISKNQRSKCVKHQHNYFITSENWNIFTEYFLTKLSQNKYLKSGRSFLRHAVYYLLWF